MCRHLFWASGSHPSSVSAPFPRICVRVLKPVSQGCALIAIHSHLSSFMFCSPLYMTTLGAKPHLLIISVSCFSSIAAFHFCWAIHTQTKFICTFTPENFLPVNILTLLLNFANSYLYFEAQTYLPPFNNLSDYPPGREMPVHSRLNNKLSEDIWANNGSLFWA